MTRRQGEKFLGEEEKISKQPCKVFGRLSFLSEINYSPHDKGNQISYWIKSNFEITLQKLTWQYLRYLLLTKPFSFQIQISLNVGFLIVVSYNIFSYKNCYNLQKEEKQTSKGYFPYSTK